MSNLKRHFPLKAEGNPSSDKPWLSFVSGGPSMSETSSRAYALYALCYAPLALLAYLIVWRGRLLKHIRFFRDSITKYPYIVDLATGDGTLTKKALFPLFQPEVEGLLALDISEPMLGQAAKKLPPSKTLLVHGDVMKLPFHTDSVKCLTCFGGFNSFSSGEAAMAEMARVLDRGGVLRGSVLFTPQRAWKKRAVDLFIRWGLQTEHVNLSSFTNWIDKAGLRLTESKRYGDVFLFEVSK